MMRSLQARLLIGLAGGTSLVLVVFGLLLFELIRAELYREFDLSMANEARALAALVEDAHGRIQTEIVEHNLTIFQPDHAVLYSIWNEDGAVVEQSAGLGDVALTPFGGTLEQPEFRSVVLRDQVAGRMVGMKFNPHLVNPGGGVTVDGRAEMSPSTVTLVVVRDTQALRASLVQITSLLVGVFGSAIVVLILLTWPIVRASLRPLQRISAQIATLGTDDLGQRLDTAKAPEEVTAVIDCLNDLMGRLHDAFGRERAFSANVAHELRTPLAGLHTTIDVALHKPVESGNDRRALKRCLDICKQAEVLTENLLTLARLDARQYQRRDETVDLDALLRKAWAPPMADRAQGRGLNIAWANNGSIRLTSDAALLSLIVRNLFDNAVSYSDPGGRIDVRTGMDDATPFVEIRNSASAVSANLEQNVFDRFWRGETSRSATGEHAGLGLSLCKEAAQLLGAKLTVVALEGIFAARLCIPSSGDEQ